MNRSLASMLLATFVLRVSTAITGGMLVFYVDDLTKGTNTGPRDIAILHGGFYATELTGAIVFGILADRYGRKAIMLLGPLFGAAAVFMTGLTSRIPILFVTRLLEGASTAASVPSTLGFIAAETAHDMRLRGRVVALFELVSLGGLLALGPALSGILWEAFERPAFFLNCLIYLVAFALYWYGVTEVPREVADAAQAQTRRRISVARYVKIATSRSVMLFAPTWLAINAVIGIWASQAPLLLTGNKHDPSQYLMQGISPAMIGFGSAALAVFFGAGLLFWGSVYSRFRRTTMLLWGVAAFILLSVDVFAINHFGGISIVILAALVAVLLFALFVLSGATPVALGFLADVSEAFHEDRSAIMGLYSVFFGLGQVAGAIVGGAAGSVGGFDGLVVATLAVIAVGLGALLNLRAHESEIARTDTADATAAPGQLLGIVRSAGEGWNKRQHRADVSAREDR